MLCLGACVFEAVPKRTPLCFTTVGAQETHATGFDVATPLLVTVVAMRMLLSLYQGKSARLSVCRVAVAA